MNDIVEFLNARLDEDEAVAREAIDPDRPGAHWEWEAPNDDGDPESPLWLRTVEEFPTTSGVGDLPGFPLGSECMAAPSVAMAHIARHDPARVLREVEAKRQIIADHYYAAIPESCSRCVEDHDAYPMPCPTLRALAWVWLDHPDYQEVWKP